MHCMVPSCRLLRTVGTQPLMPFSRRRRPRAPTLPRVPPSRLRRLLSPLPRPPSPTPAKLLRALPQQGQCIRTQSWQPRWASRDPFHRSRLRAQIPKLLWHRQMPRLAFRAGRNGWWPLQGHGAVVLECQRWSACRRRGRQQVRPPRRCAA